MKLYLTNLYRFDESTDFPRRSNRLFALEIAALTRERFLGSSLSVVSCSITPFDVRSSIACVLMLVEREL